MRVIRYYEWNYESLRGITRGLRYCEWFFRDVPNGQDKSSFMISSDSDTTRFALLYL